MPGEETIIHRGRWEGQPFPNSFESFRLYGGGVEADIKLLKDNKTLVVAHPADFNTTHEAIEGMDLEEFNKLRVKNGEEEGGAAPLFNEYLLGSYDRGVNVSFEITASTLDRSKQVARQAVETVKRFKEAGAFKVSGQEYPEFIEQMAKYYEIVIFTASLPGYADFILDLIDPEKHISYRLYRDQC